MLHTDQVEELITLAASMDRPQLNRQLREYPASIHLDFTDEYLDRLPIERLRHIFVAVCLHSQRMPTAA